MSLELHSTCISVLQKFLFFFRPPPKFTKFQWIFAKFWTLAMTANNHNMCRDPTRVPYRSIPFPWCNPASTSYTLIAAGAHKLQLHTPTKSCPPSRTNMIHVTMLTDKGKGSKSHTVIRCSRLLALGHCERWTLPGDLESQAHTDGTFSSTLSNHLHLVMEYLL
jgi:hypothetical protein